MKASWVPTSFSGDPVRTTLGERSDCVVRALATAAGISYSAALESLSRHGRKRRRGAYPNTFEPAYAEHGFVKVELKAKTRAYVRKAHFRRVQWGEQYVNGGLVVTSRTSMTLGQFLRQFPSGRFIVHFRRHAIAVIDGVVYDESPQGVKKVVECYFARAS